MKTHLLPLLIVIISNIGFSQKDSLLNLSDLHFKNPDEKSIFKKVQDNKWLDDPIAMFITPYSKNEGYNLDKANQKINDCVKHILSETENKSEPKKMKFIYNYVHDLFLKTYQLDNSFSDIFENGNYNCVSASALYAIIFTKLHIPFQIIEKPEHVFLIAYPNTHKMVIETTNPQSGYYQISKEAAERYVKYLYQNKLISQMEYNSQSHSELFNKYYFSESEPDLKDLAGIQYSNFCIYMAKENKHKESVEYIKKSYYLSPTERNKYLLKTSLQNVLVNSQYSSLKQVADFALLCKLKTIDEETINNERIHNEFLRVLHGLLVENSNAEDMGKAFVMINNSISDSTLKQNIAFSYHYESARLNLYSGSKKENTRSHLVEAYRLKPKHADLQNMIISLFSSEIDNDADVKSVMHKTEQYEKDFPFVAAKGQFGSVKANCLLELSYQNLAIGDIKKGEALIAEYEELQNRSPDIKPSENFVEKAYSTVAVYYYKKGNRLKSREYLKNGLKYAPDNFGLKIRLNQTN